MSAIHQINIYEKPKIGNDFIVSRRVYNYKHRIAAIGGFDTMNCDILMRSSEEGQQYIDTYLGNRVAVFAENPAEPIWEGFINRMRFTSGKSEWTISLDELTNRAQTIATSNLSSPTPTIGTVDNVPDSQAVYGIKGVVIDAGIQNTGTSMLTAMRDTNLSKRAWPKASIMPLGGGQRGDNLLHMECLGFYHTLNWETYINGSTGSTAISTNITTDMLPVLANGATFFNNADVGGVETNANLALRLKNRGATFWEVLKEYQEVGDGTNLFVVGITPTDFNIGTRRLYYRAFNTAVDYRCYMADGMRVRDKFNRIVPPYMVRPDTGIRINDALIAYDGLGDNPTETWIGVVDYDMNSQSVQWRGIDDLAAEGIFDLRRFSREHGRSFSAARRTT